MIAFATIVFGAALLAFSALGIGQRCAAKALPAAAILCGWVVLLLVAALVWLFELPAAYLAPVLALLVAMGGVTAFRQCSRGELLLGLGGIFFISVCYALPFALQDRLLAYAHWGTDQWGYDGVSKWLVLHSVKELPVFDGKPGLVHVWKILVLRDRPLIYEIQALLAAGFGSDATIAYYLLPAAVQGSLFLALTFSGELLGVSSRLGRSGIALALALPPIVWLHFQHQFAAGAVSAALMLILVAALLEQHVDGRREAGVFLAATWLGLLLGPLYTLNLSYAAVGLTLLLWLPIGRRSEPVNADAAAPRCWRTVAMPLLFGLAAAFAVWSHFAAQETTPGVRGDGSSTRILAQIGAVFGETEITPWYQRPTARGALGISPTDYAPPSSGFDMVCVAVTLALALTLGWRWWRVRRSLGPLIVLGAAIAAIGLASPPRGDNVLLSRALPIFAPLGLLALGVLTGGTERRWLRGFALVLVCLPLLRALPGMTRMLRHPVNTFAEGQWTTMPDGDTWSCGAYTYFYQDTRSIDWNRAPQAYYELTHELPPALKARLVPSK